MKDDHQLLKELTLEEKAALCAGQDSWHTRAVERLRIPAIMLTDGPHGLRKEIGNAGIGLAQSTPSTCFPTASCLASSWDRDLLFEVARAIAAEALEEEVSVVLAPGANIKRSPLCGRNFEYFSEDPYLTGEMASAWISGLQSRGVGASLKHFAANNQETRRMSMDAQLDERALREIYLAGFEIAVNQAKPWTLMAAYNRLNGYYCCEHPYLLGEILREEWGFKGLVMSDWGAVNDRVAGLKAGLDLEMPGAPNGNMRKIIAAVESGQLAEQVLDAGVLRVLELVRAARQSRQSGLRCDREAHHTLARRAAAEGCVLLKNEKELLPLKKNAHIALIGAFARQPRYQGAGSSLINPYRLDNLHDEMLKLAGGLGRISYAAGYTLKDNGINPQLLSQAAAMAGSADVAVVCVGLPDMSEVEGLDRHDLNLPRAHDALVEVVARANPNTVVLLSNGAPVEMPWVQLVGAILEGYLGGQAGAGGQADVLYGISNPGGKLAESFPLKLEDHPSNHHFPGGPRTVEYRESIFVGYRGFDALQKEVLFPFGHGLSYTSFAYSQFRLSRRKIAAGESLKLNLKVRNSGRRRGSEIVQLYVQPAHSPVFRPVKELKGFEKITLKPGEEKTLRFELDARAFAYFDADAGGWRVLPGTYTILVGTSSRDIRLSRDVVLLPQGGHQSKTPGGRYAIDYLSEGSNFSREKFEVLLGRPLPENQPDQRGAYTINTPIGDMHTWFGRLLRRIMIRQLKKLVSGFENTPQAVMMEEMVSEGPLRNLLMFGGDRIKPAMVNALLLLANGDIGRGLIALLKARRSTH